MGKIFIKGILAVGTEIRCTKVWVGGASDFTLGKTYVVLPSGLVNTDKRGMSFMSTASEFELVGHATFDADVQPTESK